MTKRPIGIYFIAFWFFMGLWTTVSFLKRALKENEAFGDQTIAIVAIFSISALIFVIWEVVGLVLLKKTHRLISIIFFSIWTLSVVINLTILAIEQMLTSRKLLVYLIVFIVNSIALFYLMRPSFRTVSDSYCKERNVALLQKHVINKEQGSDTKLQRNIRWIIAIALCVLVLLIYQTFVQK